VKHLHQLALCFCSFLFTVKSPYRTDGRRQADEQNTSGRLHNSRLHMRSVHFAPVADTLMLNLISFQQV